MIPILQSVALPASRYGPACRQPALLFSAPNLQPGGSRS